YPLAHQTHAAKRTHKPLRIALESALARERGRRLLASMSDVHSQDGKTLSSWWDGIDLPQFKPLDGDRSCDVCVVGAGIAELSVAYHLCRQGKKVIVVDDSQVGDGQSGRTSAHLSSEWDDRYMEAERSLGAEASALIYDSHATAIDTIEQIAKRENIDCDFARVDGWLFLGPGDETKLL